MKFLHTMIRVKDIDASLKFYTELLNMKLDKKKRLDDCELYFLNDEDGTCQIELTYNDETPKEGTASAMNTYMNLLTLTVKELK